MCQSSEKISNTPPTTWKTTIHCNLKLNSLNYFIIFLSGILFSSFIYSIIHYMPAYNRPRYLPSENSLKLSDEHALIQAYQELEFEKLIIAQQEKLNKNKAHDSNEFEALSTLKVAVEMKKLGKDDKALRLFQHALVLAPKHPEILTKYGEFLEHNQQDIVTANQLYTKALSVNPGHSDALTNQQRTAQIVVTLDEQRFERLDQKRDALSSIHTSNPSLKRVEKEAYIHHIYHSVGIEGNTMSLAQTRSILETRMAVGGKSIDEHNEIIGLDMAMKYVNASLVNKNDYMTLKDILEIHKRVLGHVDPIEGGIFRRTQVYVGSHVPPAPSSLSTLMNHFEAWLNSDEAFRMHPVKYSALAHYKLVNIHPFTDGNGRTSRLLMNTILMRAGFPPIIIQKQERHKYYEFIQIANEGDVRPFIRFIADCTERTLDLYLWATSELSHPVPLLVAQESLETIPIVTEFKEKEDKHNFSGRW